MNSSPLHAEQLSAGTLYRLFSGAVAPRPIAWVSSINAQGQANLAPFSFFNVASVDPPVLVFSPLLNGQGEAKDTTRNLEAGAECIIHIGGEPLAGALNATSAPLHYGEDEFTHAGLTKAPLGELKVPRIAEARVAFGCRVREVIHFGDRPLAGNLVLAEVVVIHADEQVWDGRHVNLEALQPIGRLAGSDFVRCSDRFALERPS